MSQSKGPYGGIFVGFTGRTGCELVADGTLAKSEIARKLGICRKTLYNWAADPVFTARVETLVAEYRSEATRRGLALREQRLARSTTVGPG